MKALDIAFKDLTRSFRSTFAVIFMFGVPLLVTGMFYFMFGKMAETGEFDLPKTKVIIANLDEGGPKLQVNPKDIPGGKKAKTMGELVINILQSEELADLIEVVFAADATAARSAVDSQQAQVALIIPADFSEQFADLDGKAVIEFYQDPTLTIGPAIMRSILQRFTDGMAGVKIAANLFMDEAAETDRWQTGLVVQRYLDESLTLSEDPGSELLFVQSPSSPRQSRAEESRGSLLRMVGSIMGGMLVFYAFYTGASTAESILREEEERTLPRLFTTPTPQRVILTGKFLAVLMTVAVQVVVLLLASQLIFKIQWGEATSAALASAGIILSASAFGVCVNSFMKNTKQGAVLFGGVLAVTGMLGMIPIFSMGSPSSASMTTAASLLVPQGWAVRALTQTMNGDPAQAVLLTTLVLLAWGVVFFIIGVWRFNRRYT